MPKEIAHFVMARMVGNAMSHVHSPFSEAVGRFPLLFTLGAVAPDINFYCLAGPDAEQTQALSAPFHRTDRQALLPVLGFLDRQDPNGDEFLPALALAAGAVCHIMSDTVFHPMVYYYAGMGGLHPGATARHRQFETAMDLYFWQADPCEHRLGKLLSSLEISRREVVSLLAGLFRPGPLGCRAVNRALQWHTGVQYLFYAPWMKLILAGLSKLGRPLPQKATGLVYPFRHAMRLPFFDGRIAYCDPCTWEKRETRIMDMAREAADGALLVLALAAEGMQEKKNLAKTLTDHPGLPPIRPDLPAEGFRLWKEEENIMPRLYRGYSPPF